MGTLVKFELKKLFNKKMNIIVIIVCLFLITLLFSMAGKDFLARENLIKVKRLLVLVKNK